ncbi:MAG: hypothetical protein CMJ83_17745 [Planctomycetes bacterium]|nr:hypothetical protein [Planctomycetota bacterium]
MTGHDRCEELSPLLFALLENEVSSTERNELTAHLAYCDPCRGALEDERRLSERLGAHAAIAKVSSAEEPASPRFRFGWSRAVAAALIVAALLIAPALMDAPRSYGAIRHGTLGVSLTWEDGVHEALARANHLDIPAGSRASLDVDGVGTVTATGPAVFELDKTPSGWKLTLLAGRVAVDLGGAGKMQVSTLHGTRLLSGGAHRVTLDPAFVADAPVDPKGFEELLARGMTAFSKSRDARSASMAEAARLLAWAANHREASDRDRNHARFYLVCALANTNQLDAAHTSVRQWLRDNPTDRRRSYALMVQVSVLARMGKFESARVSAQELKREHPNSNEAARVAVLEKAWSGSGVVSRAAPGTSTLRARPGAVSGGYLVVATALDPKRPEHADYLSVAKRAAAFHHAEVVAWDGKDVGRLTKEIRQRKPENVLLVVPPDVLDVNLHRAVFKIASSQDDDPCADFAFGWFTARDGIGIKRLWKRTKRLHQKGLASRRWIGSSVISGRKSLVIGGNPSRAVHALGFKGEQLWCAEESSDPDVRAFVKRELPRLEGAGVITLVGNGDPQGIWLFDDHRNADASTHWPFDPAKVGHDPKDEMPRITAEQFRKLNLDGALLWSGTCHSGATHRVFVEGDIVSTFGKTETQAIYDMPPKESLCLAFLDAGATALMVPIASNHGMSVSRESDFGVQFGATLGEMIKSSWDDALIEAGGPLRLAHYVKGGAPSYHRQHIMRGSAANRMLIGDPALRPFAAAALPGETVVTSRSNGSIIVTVDWASGFHSWGWDMYGDDRQRDWRVMTRVPLEDDDPKSFTTTGTVSGEDGKDIPCKVTAVVEEYHGRRYLHLQANGPRVRMAYKALKAVFTAK